MNKEIRWKQRFENFKNAFIAFKNGLEIKKPSVIEKQWIIQWFEFTFELAWKVIKDFLESKWVVAQFPRDVIKKAFEWEIIKDWHIWVKMLEDRNKLSHIYDQKQADEIYKSISKKYWKPIEEMYTYFKNQT